MVARVLGVLGLVMTGLLLFVLFTSIHCPVATGGETDGISTLCCKIPAWYFTRRCFTWGM